MIKFVFTPRREINKVEKKGKPRDIKIGVLLPIPYKAASSSLFMQFAYEYINRLDDVIAYRYVYDIDENVLESLDQNIALKNLDAVFISSSFELDYINIAKILTSFELTPRHRKNKKPLIIAGGLAPSANPLPLTEIVDAVVIGEAEEVIDNIVYAVGNENPLKVLEGIKCVAVSPFNYIVKKCFVDSLDIVYHSMRQVYSLDEEPIYGYGVRIELSRGCPYLCPFCFEGHVLYPFRYRSREVVERIISHGLNYSIARRVIFYSLSLYSIPYIDILLEKLYGDKIAVSIPSIRPDHVNKERLNLLYELGQKTITIAPETLIKDLGCCISKCVDLDHLIELVANAYKIGYEHVKMYLITGFPGVDINDELNMLKIFIDKLKMIKRYNFLEISLNILIPKPWTPYQYLPPIHVLRNADRIKKYKELLKNYSFVYLSSMDSKWGFVQAVIAQGDKTLSRLLIECAMRKCTPTTFINLIKSKDEFNYVYSGWNNELPWIKIIDIGFNTKYLEHRFNYLSSKFQK